MSTLQEILFNYFKNNSIKKRHPLLTPRKASIIDLNTANALFAEIINSGIPFGYQQANCHNISHYISLLLESKGYQCAKIWAFAPVVYSSYSSRIISFPDKKKLSPNGAIDWGYHVAPVLKVRMGTKVRKMVIDPGLFPKGPVRYRTWIAKLKTRKLIYLIMDSEWYLFNSSTIPNSQILPNPDIIKPNIKLPDWFSDKHITDFFKYEEDSLNEHWIEKGLAVNETTETFYNKEIKPILNSNLQEDILNDYKMLVGNVFNFETVFRDHKFNSEMNDDFQLKHQKIITKYREIYLVNLNKWQNSLSELNEIIRKKFV